MALNAIRAPSLATPCRWAQPSVPALRQLMRRVVERRGEAAAKGTAARVRMVERYSPDVVARLVAAQLAQARPRGGGAGGGGRSNGAR